MSETYHVTGRRAQPPGDPDVEVIVLKITKSAGSSAAHEVARHTLEIERLVEQFDPLEHGWREYQSALLGHARAIRDVAGGLPDDALTKLVDV